MENSYLFYFKKKKKGMFRHLLKPIIYAAFLIFTTLNGNTTINTLTDGEKG